ncbi:MAG: chemotaxis protein CheW [Fusobacteriota bacterium]
MVNEETSGVNEIQVVIFELDGTMYGVPILQVQEIIKEEEVTKLPNMPDFIEGIINLRDNIIPIMDLKKRFALNTDGDKVNEKILILRTDDLQFGIRVDSISEVEKIEVSTIEEPPKVVSGVDGRYISGIAKEENRLLTILDVDEILSEKEEEKLKEI